jgi:hypothetical protein
MIKSPAKTVKIITELRCSIFTLPILATGTGQNDAGTGQNDTGQLQMNQTYPSVDCR